MAFGNYKDLSRGTESDKILRNKVSNIAKNPKHDGYQCRIATVVYCFLIKKLLLCMYGQRP